MQFDFYVQGTPEENDGDLVLSLSQGELIKAVSHPIRVLSDLTTRLSGSIASPSNGIISPSEIEGYQTKLSEEKENMRHQPPNSDKNPSIQPELYLSNVVSILSRSVTRCLAESRDLVLRVNPLEPKLNGGPVVFNRENPISLGWVGIFGARIKWADHDRRLYAGEIDWADHIERVFPTSKWVSYPIPDGINLSGENGMLTRPSEINCLTEGYDFTLLTDFNKCLRLYIADTIEKSRKLIKS